jgi:fatty acid desaturase
MSLFALICNVSSLIPNTTTMLNHSFLSSNNSSLLQIEHHMFPSMPQFRHPIISPRVKAMLEKHGLKYDQRSYVDAITVTFKNLHKVGSDVFYG